MAVVYFMGGCADGTGLALRDVLDAAHAFRVPVIVDAAAQVSTRIRRRGSEWSGGHWKTIPCRSSPMEWRYSFVF